MRMRIDINCDLGESFGNYRIGHDREIMPYITSANVACGFHAGDPIIMAKTVKLAKENQVAVGAHPGFPDLMGFGRRSMKLSKEEVGNIMIYQIGALEAFTKAFGIEMQHIKPHGALYNAAAENEIYAKAIVEAASAINPKLLLFALADSKMAKIASKAGVRVAHEVFIDRAYNGDGTLVSRRIPGSIITDVKLVVERAIKIIKEKQVVAIDGRVVKFDYVHTLCVHGDTSNSVELAKSVRNAVLDSNIDVLPAGAFV